MRSLIITVAGCATRFNRDTQADTLKCLYWKGRPENSLLSQIISKCRGYDEIVIVGGYLYEILEDFTVKHLGEYKGKIKLVYNPHFKDYGSGYSLILGILNISNNSDEVLFVEGDLYFDKQDIGLVIGSTKDCLTVNRELIQANKSVALYTDMSGMIHYLYDTAHSALCIAEPFTAIFNSGQIWKFKNTNRLLQVVSNLSDKQQKGTNLEIVQGYFGELRVKDIDIISLNVWHNCNTVRDYETVYKLIISDGNCQ